MKIIPAIDMHYFIHDITNNFTIYNRQKDNMRDTYDIEEIFQIDYHIKPDKDNVAEI